MRIKRERDQADHGQNQHQDKSGAQQPVCFVVVPVARCLRDVLLKSSFHSNTAKTHIVRSVHDNVPYPVATQTEMRDNYRDRNNSRAYLYDARNDTKYCASTNRSSQLFAVVFLRTFSCSCLVRQTNSPSRGWESAGFQ